MSVKKILLLLMIVVCLSTTIMIKRFHANQNNVLPAVRPRYETTHRHWDHGDVIKTCAEIHDVIFLKVHKTGSSTFANILERFGESRNLSFALPNKRHGEGRYNYFGGIGDTISEEKIMSSKVCDSSYNILYNHVIFNKTAFRRVFPRHVTYVTLIREPISQFISSVLFFIHQEEVFKAVTANFTAYLLAPGRFEPENVYLSYTNNRQALDLGLPPDRLHDVTSIRDYITMLDETFGLILIMERFDESLVLFKRRLCWDLKDILYMPMNKRYKNIPIKVTQQDENLYRKWAIADHLIYNHFRSKFLHVIQEEYRFEDEVSHFKRVLTSVHNFCKERGQASKLDIPRSHWNEPTSVTSLDCLYMTISELQFLEKIHRRLGTDRYMKM